MHYPRFRKTHQLLRLADRDGKQGGQAGYVAPVTELRVKSSFALDGELKNIDNESGDVQ